MFRNWSYKGENHNNNNNNIIKTIIIMIIMIIVIIIITSENLCEIRTSLFSFRKQTVAPPSPRSIHSTK